MATLRNYNDSVYPDSFKILIFRYWYTNPNYSWRVIVYGNRVENLMNVIVHSSRSILIHTVFYSIFENIYLSFKTVK